MTASHLFRLDTGSGKRVDFSNPTASDISVIDIAAALSKICRFGGHAREFYSVAQHAVLVRDLVTAASRPDLALAALHHDSHEAYICDLPAPLKRFLNSQDQLEGYTELVTRFDGAIGEAIGTAVTRHRADDRRVIERADRAAFRIEAAALLPNGGKRAIADNHCKTRGGLRSCPTPMTPSIAAQAFLEAHHASTRRVAA
jgi:hypothetical protein